MDVGADYPLGSSALQLSTVATRLRRNKSQLSLLIRWTGIPAREDVGHIQAAGLSIALVCTENLHGRRGI